MKLKKTLVFGLTAALLAVPVVARANLDFKFDWAATGQGSTGAPLSDPVRELKYTAESAIVFNGTPFTPGTTFTDYVVMRVDQLFNSSGNQILSNYGTASNMQITLLGAFTGTQTGALTYSIDGFNSLGIYYDGPNGGYTDASFAGTLNNFKDGALVERATSASGSGVNSPTAPDGSIDVNIGLLDLVSPGDFEVALNGGLLANNVIAMTNANNHLCGGAQSCNSNTTDILALFGQGANANAIHTKSDGSIEKTVPEPATLALMGLGLVGMGFAARRRKSA